MALRRRARPELITDAPEDQERELRRRERRYVAMMLTRVVALIGSAVIVWQRPPLWGLWAVLCVLGAVVLPWLAVILANDSPPRKYRPKELTQPSVEEREHKVIEPD